MPTSKILDQLNKDGVKFIQLQFTDILGIVKSLTKPVSQITDSLKNGTWFDGSSIEGFARIAESDMFLKPDLATYAVIPWLNSEDGNTARFICDVYNADGTPFEGDPRYILKKAIADAQELGFIFNTGPELEFFLFKKDNGKIYPLPQDRGGYFDLTTDQAYDIRREMTVALEKFGIEVETSHHEVGLGQHEIDFKYNEALKTADSAVTLRFVLKAIAQKYGLHATFMPKPIYGMAGSGMHVHQSLFDKNGTNIFFDENDKYKLSQTAYSFIAGQLKHIKEMSALLSPTVNSYKRLISGYEAPVYVSWASTNRSALIRIPKFSEGKSAATRVELRCPDPSCNIYLAFAVMLKSGLAGIKNNLKPAPSVEEDIYHLDESKLNELKIDKLPQSLQQALAAMKSSQLVKETLGEPTFSRYLDAKTKEWEDYRQDVSQWEIDHYLEIY